jgi:pimeloyl-ACP methyl ester carboxylesterase
MRKNRLLVALTAAVMTLTTWAVPGSTAQASAPSTTARTKAPPAITWGRCADATLMQVRAQCGFVTVPLDYSNPAGEKIQLAVSRVRHTTLRSQGVMLVNPGGPGGSGLIYSVLGPLMPKRSGAGYDWIGFDPRGVGASQPAMSCRPNYFHPNRPPYVPANQSDVQVWLERSKFYAQGCEKYGALLDHMKTIDNVRDMEQIRLALGVEKINYYGYSYGTYLGQVYATLFPSHVRRMVFDSNVDPRKIWYSSGAEQTVAFERVYDLFFRWVARHHKTYHLGRTGAVVKRQYLHQRKVLRGHPGNGVLGPSEWDDSFQIAGYLQAAWPLVAQGFTAWVHRKNPRPLMRIWRLLQTPGDDNTYAVFNAVTCSDAPMPGLSTQLADSRRLFRRAPIATWSSTWFSGPCLYWPARPGRPVMVNGHGTSALLLGQTLDGATPFEGSLEVRSRFPNSRLIAIRGGTTHGSSPDLSGPCATDRLVAYLKTGALPPRLPGRRADVSCAAPPPPQPTGATSARGSSRAMRLALRSIALR